MSIACRVMQGTRLTRGYRGGGETRLRCVADGPGESRRKVAVIGAGAAGLVSARELRRAHLDVTVFERGSSVGGTWVYTEEESERDEYHIHSSLYESLRVNLPKEIMGYSDFGFPLWKRDALESRYCSHEEVRVYLENFAKHFGIDELIEKDTLVTSAEPVRAEETRAEGGACKWKLIVKPKNVAAAGEDEGEERIFDAVVVCNGHFEVPKTPRNIDLDEAGFAGAQMHSRDYKRNDVDCFVGKRVLVVGTGPSGDDLAREVAKVASRVLWSGRGFERMDEAKLRRIKGSLDPNTELRSNVTRIRGNLVSFEGSEGASWGGGDEEVDTILWCTGYEYSVHFLRLPSRDFSTANGRIEPLYEHLFHPSYGPSLSFIGLGFRILPFPFFEIQAKWVARLLMGRAALPGSRVMEERALAFQRKFEKAGERIEMTHCMEGIQWEYLDRIVAQEGMEDCAGLQDWKIQLYELNRRKKALHPTQYRDLVLDEEWPFIDQGREELEGLLAKAEAERAAESLSL